MACKKKINLAFEKILAPSPFRWQMTFFQWFSAIGSIVWRTTTLYKNWLYWTMARYCNKYGITIHQPWDWACGKGTGGPIWKRDYCEELFLKEQILIRIIHIKNKRRIIRTSDKFWFLRKPLLPLFLHRKLALAGDCTWHSQPTVITKENENHFIVLQRTWYPSS